MSAISAQTEPLDFLDITYQHVKVSAYKGLAHQVLEYSSSDWDPSSILLQEELEKVQKRAARFEQTTSSMKLGA